jgi:hypothetical protein
MSEIDSSMDKQETYHRLGLRTSSWFRFKRVFQRIPKDILIDGQIIPICQHCGGILDEFTMENGWKHSLSQLKRDEGCYFSEPAKKHFTDKQLMYHNEALGVFLYWILVILYLGFCIAIVVNNIRG